MNGRVRTPTGKFASVDVVRGLVQNIVHGSNILVSDYREDDTNN